MAEPREMSDEDMYDPVPGPDSGSGAEATSLAAADAATTNTAAAAFATAPAAVTLSEDACADDDANLHSSSDMDIASSTSSSPKQLKRKLSASPAAAAANVDVNVVADADDSAYFNPLANTVPGRKRIKRPRPSHPNANANTNADVVTAPGALSLPEASRMSSVSAPRSHPKKIKDVPVEIWQHIFMKLPPANLAKCLAVTKLFNHCLTGVKDAPTTRTSQNCVQLVNSNSIWAHARMDYFPKLPKPLSRFTELEMIQLIGNEKCQFCNVEPALTSKSDDPIQHGPGAKGVNVIWPLGIRTCGPCFDINTMKDLDVFKLPHNVGFLVPGVPFALRSPDNHYIPDVLRLANKHKLNHLGLYKVLSAKDMENIYIEYEEEVRDCGLGADTEWRKGLTQKRAAFMAEASKWENWELQLKGTSPAHALKGYHIAWFPNFSDAIKRKSMDRVNAPFSNMSKSTGAVHQPNDTTQALPNPSHDTPAPTHPLPAPVFAVTRPEMQRTRPEEVKDIREARKLEIEHRSKELVPPILPDVLKRMSSFKAAILIARPLDSVQWEQLRPLLLAQRDAAEVEHEQEELEKHHRAVHQATLEATKAASSENKFPKPAKDSNEGKYALKQGPLRKQLGEYADDYIWSRWRGPPSSYFDPDTSAIFAAGLLASVHERYLQDRETADSVPDTFLSLENMRWVHDNKIRPYVKAPEVFLCTDCAAENESYKWLAFESLIQHFAAKHTDEFSFENIVVDWTGAHWPGYSPFVTDLDEFLTDKPKNKGWKSQIKAPQHGRASQNRQRSHANNPGSSLDLSQHPQFASSAPSTSNGQSTMRASQLAPNAASANTDPQPDPNIWKAQLEEFSLVACSIWHSLDGVVDLTDCIRLRTAFYHAKAQFSARFSHDPELDLLTDLMLKDEDFQALRNAKGLACRICVSAKHPDRTGDSRFYFSRIRDVKLFTLPTLTNHCQIQHPDRANVVWWEKMFELPEPEVIQKLPSATGMTDEKLRLISAAFPLAFPDGLPMAGQQSNVSDGAGGKLLARMKGWQGGKKGSKKSKHTTATDSGEIEDLTGVGENEYDPRSPWFFRQEPSTPQFDPSRFDTDLSRDRVIKQEPSSSQYDPSRFDTDLARDRRSKGSSVPETGMFGLDPSTLAQVFQANAPAQATYNTAHRDQRRPSVGRAESPRASQTSGPPDISSILAALQGPPKQPEAPPPTTYQQPLPSPGMYPPAQTQPVAYNPASQYAPAQHHAPQWTPAPPPPPMANPYPQASQYAQYYQPVPPPPAQPPRQQVIHHDQDGSLFIIDENGYRVNVTPVVDDGPPPQTGWAHHPPPPAPPGYR